ncbi:MAG: hypothetical protein KDA16_02845 [Phycisphaerales bacterium]|nr:hypothetical protein [Phycisphaerales bacterium]
MRLLIAETDVVWKFALLILIGAGAGASLLVVRQQRLQAVHEMTEAAERMIEMERTLWRLRAEIASRVTPQDLEEEYASRQAMEPIPLEWCLPDGTPVTAADAMHDPFGMGGGGRGAGD